MEQRLHWYEFLADFLAENPDVVDMDSFRLPSLNQDADEVQNLSLIRLMNQFSAKTNGFGYAHDHRRRQMVYDFINQGVIMRSESGTFQEFRD